jgi:DNA-binding transcriptional MerR regulator
MQDVRAMGHGEQRRTSWKIGELARRHGLSRSTLLYYDRIGLLSPSRRQANGYRQYAREDEERLARIVRYRKTGASMSDIRRMVDGGEGSLRAVLEQLLEQLNGEVEGLREQQRVILGLLRSARVKSVVGVMNVKLWVSLLKASGFGREEMERWHGAFERSRPAEHQRFLEFLCIPRPEIALIRRRSRGRIPARRPG